MGIVAALLAVPQRASSNTATTPLNVEAADRFADAVASVNAPLCKNPQGVGPNESASARIEWAYLVGLHFRHVRDGFLTCYNQAAFTEAWRKLASHGTQMLATELFTYSDDELRTARIRNPAVEAISAGNEWDSEKLADVKLVHDVSLGENTIGTGSNVLANKMVVGQRYRFDDGTNEEFTLSAAQGRSLGKTANKFQFAHKGGTHISRVGDFVTDLDNWLAYYAPRLHKFGFPVVGPSLAFPLHASAFTEFGDRRDGKYGLDAVEEHGYPVPMGSNPEGRDGDGKRGYISVNHPPCSFARTSYSVAFDTCEIQMQTGETQIPIWETEFSYTVVDNGSGPLPDAPHPLPDRVAASYLARSEFFLAAHQRTRLYWFQMLDGTSGPNSGFCSYGLIFTGLCADQKHADAPMPKAELLTLGSLIAYFSDSVCRFPTCAWHPDAMRVGWSDASLPLNASAFGWKSGKRAIVAWLGAESYDFESKGTCVMDSSCTLHVPARNEELNSPALHGARNVTIATIDIDPNDPLPPESSVASPDGSTESIRRCPFPAKQNFYGCITPSKPLDVRGDSVKFAVGDVPSIVTFEPHGSIP